MTIPTPYTSMTTHNVASVINTPAESTGAGSKPATAARPHRMRVRVLAVSRRSGTTRARTGKADSDTRALPKLPSAPHKPQVASKTPKNPTGTLITRRLSLAMMQKGARTPRANSNPESHRGMPVPAALGGPKRPRNERQRRVPRPGSRAGVSLLASAGVAGFALGSAGLAGPLGSVSERCRAFSDVMQRSAPWLGRDV